MTAIHPLAVVNTEAQIGQDVEIGPFSVIEAGVTIGDRCRIASHVVLKSGTTLAADNTIGEGSIIGGMPQHIHVPDRPGGLVIGSGNTIREHCTIHRSLTENGITRIGNANLLMVGVHVAHDCAVGDHVIMTNGVMLAGHVEIADRAYLGGGAAVHQFCRIGRLTMIGGKARIKKDVPPFVMVDDATSLIAGLNSIGLRRNGFTADDIAQLKAAYRVIYRQGLPWSDVVPALQREFSEGPAVEFHQFLAGGTRGFTPERRTPKSATIKLHRSSIEVASEIASKAG